LTLLECYDEKHDTFRAQDFSSQLDLPISTVYRYLEILTQHRFLHKNPLTKRYHLGILIHRLGRLAGDESSLVQVALPFLEDLSNQSHETVFLTVLSNGESVCIKRIESSQRIRLTIEEGVRQPLHAGASSRILLAYQTETFIKKWIASNDLHRFTPTTICNHADLLKVLKLTRKQGYTMSDSEVDAGSIALAAPIFGPRKKLVAGLSLAGPKDRMSNEVKEGLITIVVRVAGDISQQLGFKS
jgi:DNA-binding IclR family transcriptional regulator